MNIALPDELEIALLLQFPEHKRKISAIEQIDFITGFCTPNNLGGRRDTVFESDLRVPYQDSLSINFEDSIGSQCICQRFLAG
jgi:hypothetical protein